MKQLHFYFIFMLLLPFLQTVKAQDYAAVDTKILQLPDSQSQTTAGIARYINAHFTTNEDKVRAIFIWLATNIVYDVDNMFAINFYEKKEDIISKALKTRKGICANYAELFTDICTKSGVKAFTIDGYTKQAGAVDYVPHAWNAALIDTTWFLFDATWASGYVAEDEFVRELNEAYYKVSPEKLIESHIPFDYLWQLLHYPISNQAFYKGTTQQDKTQPFFSFKDSIQVYEKQNPLEQLIATAYRVEKNGVKNSLIYDRLYHLKVEIENKRNAASTNLFNKAVDHHTKGVDLLNQFIEYKNKQFTPSKPDAEIQEMLTQSEAQLKAAKETLGQLTNPYDELVSSIQKLEKATSEASSYLAEQQTWLTTYFSKGKSGRRAMFYERKITVWGIPVN